MEREPAAGDGAAYRRHLRNDAASIVPGAILDKEAAVTAMDASPGWDDVTFAEEMASDFWLPKAAAAGCRCRLMRTGPPAPAEN